MCRRLVSSKISARHRFFATNPHGQNQELCYNLFKQCYMFSQWPFLPCSWHLQDWPLSLVHLLLQPLHLVVFAGKCQSHCFRTSLDAISASNPFFFCWLSVQLLQVGISRGIGIRCIIWPAGAFSEDQRGLESHKGCSSPNTSSGAPSAWVYPCTACFGILTNPLFRYQHYSKRDRCKRGRRARSQIFGRRYGGSTGTWANASDGFCRWAAPVMSAYIVGGKVSNLQCWLHHFFASDDLLSCNSLGEATYLEHSINF